MSDGGPRDGSAGGVEAQIVGLARDVDSLRRMVDRHDRTVGTVAGRLTDLEAQVGSSVTTLAGLSEQVAELAAGDQVSGAHRSWFDPIDLVQAGSRLGELVHWLEQVYLQFPDAALPSCWMWHPSVVEELLWLRHSWIEAFTGTTAAIFRVADWHDRQRPGVVARIRSLNDGVCSLDQHARGAEQDRRSPSVPAADAVPAIAGWWSARREAPPPDPSEVQLTDGTDGYR